MKINKFTRHNFSLENLGGIIDHTNIQKSATEADIIKTCKEAKEFGFRGVCIRSEWISLVRQELNGTNIKVICLVDPPIGDSSHQKRIKICKKAKKEGVDELDVVASIPDIKHERWARVLNDLKEICKILPTKVIIGSGYLTDEEIIKTSQIVKKAGAFCVKTATEKDPLEHRELKEKFFHLKLMRKGAPGLLIKAAGSIKNLSDAKKAIKAGADIIGSSYGVAIIKEAKNKKFSASYKRKE